MEISTAGMDRETWLRYRKRGLGGSDAGAICGLNPYASPMSVYRDKTGENTGQEDNEAMRQGRDLEEYVARRFTEATGCKVRRSNKMYFSREHPFMLADVDRLLVGEDAGLECKTASPYNADKWKDGQIPAHYLLQCHHYMAVTGKKAWYIAVVILGQDFQYRRIERDEDLIRDLVAIERDFWENHVTAGVMPDPDGSRACDEVIGQYFRKARAGTEIPLVGFDEKLDRREEIIGLMKKLETEQKTIEQEVKLYMEHHETAASGRYRVTWSNVDTIRVDATKLKSDAPEIYREFSRKISSRRFAVKAA